MGNAHGFRNIEDFLNSLYQNPHKCPPPTAAAAPYRHNVVFAHSRGGAKQALVYEAKQVVASGLKRMAGEGAKKNISLKNHWGGKHPNDDII